MCYGNRVYFFLGGGTHLKIMCDSTSDLPLTYIEEHGIELFPITITLGDREYRDAYDIETEKIYESITKGIHPKTSQVAVAEFLKTFTRMAKEQENGIYIALSSKLSGTYRTALMVYEGVKQEYPDFDLRIVDSKTVSVGAGVQVAEAVKLKDAGKTLDEIEERVRFMAGNMLTLFTLSDLGWVAEGGRISKSAAAIGSVLQINPVMELVDGAVEITEKIRGKKRVIKRIMEVAMEKADQPERQLIGIAYSDDLAKRSELVEAVQTQLAPQDILVRPIGASIAAHAGLGTLGIVFLTKYE